MRCSKCGAEGIPGKKFCAECGGLLSNRCSKCGSESAPSARFCADCGAPLGTSATAAAKKSDEPQIRIADAPAPEPLEGERKTVTALFADIKGSMDLIEDLDPEEARALVDPALKLMIESVRRYGGYVAQSTGDGIFALFGAPLAYEDHPLRALYAALRMQEDVKGYAEKLRAENGVSLQVRVGVNSGEVVLRSIKTDEARTEYTAIGHSTSLAARLQALATPGSIAITEPVSKLVEGYFALKAMGPARIKGVSEPVNLFEVTGLGSLRTPMQRSVARGLTKFVGRQREMEALRHAAGLIKEGHGQIAAVMAEAGSGKSRLFFEFKATCAANWMVLETFSVLRSKASAYLPLIELLHGYFGIERDDDARKRRERVGGKVLMLDRALEDTLPYLFGLIGVGEEETLAQMDPQLRGRRTLDAIKRILLRESLNQPLMVIFEDLHWIDDETQAFLNLLVDSIAIAKILLLVNYRPEYSHSWNSKTYYTQLRLDPLGKESADEMLQSLLGDDSALALLKRVIIEKTEGNPFFMEETVLMLLDEGALKRNGAAHLTHPLSELKIPATVQTILASRIDRLPQDEKDILQTLAVIGGEFAVSLVQRVVPKSESEVRRMLHALQLAEFIYERPATGDIKYVFKHALTYEVAYKSMLMERRELLHERIGSALEEQFAQSIDDHLIDLAFHYGRSPNSGKAVEYLDRAGQQATNRGAPKEGELYLKQAIDTLSRTPETLQRASREFNLRYALWEVLQITHGPVDDESVQATRRLAVLAEKTGDPEQLINALRAAWYSTYYGKGGMTAAQQFAEQLMEIARRSGSRFGLTCAHFYQGTYFYFRGALIQAMQHYEKTVEFYDAADFRKSLLDPQITALSRIGVLLWHLGTADQGRAKIREAISLSERSKNPRQILDALSLASSLYIYLREPRHVEEVAERLSTHASELQVPSNLAWGCIYRGWAAAEQGRTDEGIALIRAGISSMATLGRGPDTTTLRWLSEAQWRAGQLKEALGTIEQAVSVIGEQQSHLPGVLWRRGELYLCHGDKTLADRDFREAIAVARRIGSKAYELRAATGLARRRLPRQSACDTRGNIRLVHRRVRYRRFEGRQGSDRRPRASSLKPTSDRSPAQVESKSRNSC